MLALLVVAELVEKDRHQKHRQMRMVLIPSLLRQQAQPSSEQYLRLRLIGKLHRSYHSWYASQRLWAPVGMGWLEQPSSRYEEERPELVLMALLHVPRRNQSYHQMLNRR